MIDPCPPGFVAVRHPAVEAVHTAARAARRVWQHRPRVSGHGVKRHLAHGAAAAGKAVTGAAVATGVTIVCERVVADRAAWLIPPAQAVPIEWPATVPYGGGYGWPGAPGWLGPGGGVLWPAWVGGPAPGDTTAVVPPVGSTTSTPPFVSPPAVPPGVGPGAIPPGVVVTTPFVPPEAPRDVPEPSASVVVGVGLAALAWARTTRKGRER